MVNWTPDARLAQFMMGTTKHCYIQNIQVLGLVVSEKISLTFCIVSLWEIDAPWAWSIWTPGARSTQFILRTTKYCYIQNIEALGLVVS